MFTCSFNMVQYVFNIWYTRVKIIALTIIDDLYTFAAKKKCIHNNSI